MTDNKRLAYLSALPTENERTIKSIGIQFQPYYDYLYMAKHSLENLKPKVNWREATKNEREIFVKRRKERYQKILKRSQNAKRRREKVAPKSIQSGFWIVLEPIGENGNLEDFLSRDANIFFRNEPLEVLSYDREGQALLVKKLLMSEEEESEKKNNNKNELYLKPNTYPLRKQIDSIRRLKDSPSLSIASLVNRWVIVGDTKQLSPYVEDDYLSKNITGLVPKEMALAAVCSFSARNYYHQYLIPTSSPKEHNCFIEEAEKREVDYLNLDEHDGETSIAFLASNLLIGSVESIQKFEDDLPYSILPQKELPELKYWNAIRRVNQVKPTIPLNWGEQISWRLTRAYELRQNKRESI